VAQAPPRDGVVRLFRERGGRHGKTVTVIHGLPERGPALAARLSELKRLCGAGGTVKEALGGAAAGEPTGSMVIEIQGDHRERLAERLRALGYRVKLAGG
jgi:translation initiation factor 1